MRADKEASKWPEDKREAFWDGYICGIKTFEEDMCLQRTNADCPYVAPKVAEKMKQVVRLP